MKLTPEQVQALCEMPASKRAAFASGYAAGAADMREAAAKAAGWPMDKHIRSLPLEPPKVQPTKDHAAFDRYVNGLPRSSDVASGH
jgi:hypothetical protein